MGTFTKKMSNLSQFTVLIVHLVEKMLLFREVRYQIHPDPDWPDPDPN